MECDSFVSSSVTGTCSSISSSRNSLDKMEKMEKVDRVVEYHEFQMIPLEETNEKCIRKRVFVQSSGRIRPTWKGPLKTLRLLIVVAILPALFIAVPLYLRYFVFSAQMYPVGMSDMRLIDKKVSTTWCQKQVIQANNKFNAFLVSSQPKFAKNLVPVSMTRHLLLDDDMKEYWGFYLLQGSIVTVSTCVRWPGASLIMIRGHKHLQECAYIGDDSSEELEELLEANGGKLTDENILKIVGDSLTNKPHDMIRQLGNIKFHEPRQRDGTHKNHTKTPGRDLSEERDPLDPKVLKQILEQLQAKQKKRPKNRTAKQQHKHIVNIPELIHRYRDTNVNEDEEKFLSFKDLEVNHDNLNKSKSTAVESKTLNNINVKNDEIVETSIKITTIENGTKDTGEIKTEGTLALKINSTTAKNATKEINENLLEVLDEDEEEGVMSSSEIFDDIFKKLTKLGKKGKSILTRLNNKLSSKENLSTSIDSVPKANSTLVSEEDVAEEKLSELRKLLVDIMEEQKNKRAPKRSWKNEKREKRDIVLSTAMQDHLNEEDEKGNAAIEEGFVPDGVADHHSIINETTLNDMSHSEFWSSFSSSEEALLECDGLILNLPLTPHKGCQKTSSASTYDEAALANTITYKVPTNGYYFFVFNSENELQTNYIKVQFDIQKIVYDLSNHTVECKNSSSECSMPLSFFSTEKVVLEVPISDNDSMWNEEFVVMSECVPRTSIYIVCVITVPILILVTAFQ